MSASVGLSSVVADLVGRIAYVEVRPHGHHAAVLRVRLGERVVVDRSVDVPSATAAYAACLHAAAVGVTLAVRARASAVVLSVRCTPAARALDGTWKADAGRRELALLNRAIGAAGSAPVYLDAADGLGRVDTGVTIADARPAVPPSTVAPPPAPASPSPRAQPTREASQACVARSTAAANGAGKLATDFDELLDMLN